MPTVRQSFRRRSTSSRRRSRRSTRRTIERHDAFEARQKAKRGNPQEERRRRRPGPQGPGAHPRLKPGNTTERYNRSICHDHGNALPGSLQARWLEHLHGHPDGRRRRRHDHLPARDRRRFHRLFRSGAPRRRGRAARLRVHFAHRRAVLSQAPARPPLRRRRALPDRASGHRRRDAHCGARGDADHRGRSSRRSSASRLPRGPAAAGSS